jgi:hypothetical protein
MVSLPLRIIYFPERPTEKSWKEQLKKLDVWMYESYN